MKKARFFMVGLVVLLMAGGLVMLGCKSDDGGGGGGGSKGCPQKNNCYFVDEGDFIWCEKNSCIDTYTTKCNC